MVVRDGVTLGSAEVAADRKTRRRGLLGRDGLEGVLVIEPCRQVHTFGMRFSIDVAFCDRYGFVLYRKTIARWRVTRFVWRGVLPGGVGRLWQFFKTVPFRRISAIDTVISDWIIALSMREFAQRILAPEPETLTAPLELAAAPEQAAE